MNWHRDFESLRVNVTLRSNIVCDAWLPLDAILLYQASREQFGPQAATLPGGESESQDVPMPLAIRNPGPDWYYACSWAQPQPWWVAEGIDHWNKRFDSAFAFLVDFAGKSAKVIIEKGTYRAYHMPIYYRITRQIDWFCVGDGKEIGRLLSDVTHIGKKRAQGWGRVERWSIEPWPHDWSEWREGKLTRGIPMNLIPPGQVISPMFYGLRPSYYRRENQRPLAICLS